MCFLRKYDHEPTRSVLFRSAASLAIDCKEYLEAERLIGEGLAGNPPPDIRIELRELYEQSHFQLFLHDSGLELNEGQIIVTMWGDQIAPGFASCREVIKRLTKTETLIYRTAERKIGLKYNDSTGPTDETRRRFKVYASIPMAASYAIVLRVAETERQLALPFSVDASDVVSELIECMALYNQSEDEKLQTRIQDEPYLRNFLGLARELYPSTPDVSHVGFAGKTADGNTKIIELANRPSISIKKVKNIVCEEDDVGEAMKIHGILNFAKSAARTRRIEVQDDNGHRHAVDVPEGMMADVVRPYFEARVVVDVIRYDNGVMRLLGVNPEDENK